MTHQNVTNSGTRAADVELPPSMAGLAVSDTAEATSRLIEYARRRFARLCQLTESAHKHSAQRLAEKAELGEILKVLGPFDSRADGVDATGSEGGVA